MDYRELNALASDPARVRALAAMILKMEGDRLSDGGHDLLTKLARYDGEKPLSTRQKEALHGLREQATRSTTAGPYRACDLVRMAWERRFDLADFETEQWLDEMHAAGPTLRLSRNEWRRLLAICRDPGIDLLSSDAWVELG